jgi:hypothetical protein
MYTACFDEVLAEVAPNLPDYIKPRPHRASNPHEQPESD